MTRASHLLLATAALLATGSALAARDTAPVWTVEGGNAARGKSLVTAFGCANCHTIPGVKDATGNVGPPLTRIGDRSFIAGVLRNEPANLVRWLREPQAVVPGNAMPDMGVTEQQARDIAAFLYTIR
jgi:cytochrome c2